MKLKYMMLAAAAAILSSCASFNPENVPDAGADQVKRVEPLSWWVGMNTPLQLLVQGDGISEYEVTIEGGKGVKVTGVTPGDSPNYLFVDVNVSPIAAPGTYWLVFKGKKGESFKYAYEIASRESGSAQRKSFSSADVIYLIMPDRFANGNPDNDSTPDTTEKADRNAFFGRHGGDIQGIMDHLDYIAGLGATAIWCTPLLEDNAPEESYHGYACSDYYHIDSRFGDNEKYAEYVQAAHGKGLKVIMDIVTNHCGTSHWWMQDLPFKDWIHIFPEYTNTNICFSANMDTNASKYDLNIQESGWFVPSMPDMNLDNPFVLNYFIQWGVWWIEKFGLDGFRVDTYPYNEKEPMSRWCKAITDEYPHFNIVGECWTSSIPQLAYWQKDNPNRDGFNSNLPAIMDFPLHDAIRMGLNEGAGWGCGMTRVYELLSHDFMYQDIDNMLIFLGNHDVDRFGDCIGKDPRKLKLGMAMLATMRGIPQIFAGDELLFVSADRSQGHGGLRVDFLGGWEGDKCNLFTEEGRKAQRLGTDGLPVYPGQADELFNYASKLLNWRKGAAEIHHGRTLHFLTRDNTYAYFRYDSSKAAFVFINNSDEAKTIPWSHYAEITKGLHNGRNVITGETVIPDDSTIVAAQTALVLEFDR